MAKLSKYTREQMARALVRHRFQERADQLSAESTALFNAVLDERYDAATQKLMRQLERRVPGGLKQTNDIYLRARGMRVSVGASTLGNYNVTSWVPETPSRLVLNKDDSEPSEALAERIAAFALDTQKFSEDIREAYRRALGALDQFSTAKRLTEEWPEAMPVIGHLLTVADRALPVVQLEAINDEFGLPPAELEAA